MRRGLDLSGNQLTGNIPESIGSLVNLKYAVCLSVCVTYDHVSVSPMRLRFHQHNRVCTSVRACRGVVSSLLLAFEYARMFLHLACDCACVFAWLCGLTFVCVRSYACRNLCFFARVWYHGVIVGFVCFLFYLFRF